MSDELKLKTFEVPKLLGTPYYGFAIQAHADLIGSNIVEQSDVLIRESSSTIVAQIEIADSWETIGAIVYQKTTGDISMAYVLSDFRRRGVYRYMLYELIKAAERDKLSRLSFVVPAGMSNFGKIAMATDFRAKSLVFVTDIASQETP